MAAVRTGSGIGVGSGAGGNVGGNVGASVGTAVGSGIGTSVATGTGGSVGPASVGAGGVIGIGVGSGVIGSDGGDVARGVAGRLGTSVGRAGVATGDGSGAALGTVGAEPRADGVTERRLEPEVAVALVPEVGDDVSANEAGLVSAVGERAIGWGENVIPAGFVDAASVTVRYGLLGSLRRKSVAL